VTPVIMPTGLPPYLERLNKRAVFLVNKPDPTLPIAASPHLVREERQLQLGALRAMNESGQSPDTALWPTQHSKMEVVVLHPLHYTCMMRYEGILESKRSRGYTRVISWPHIHHDSRPGAVQDSNFNYQHSSFRLRMAAQDLLIYGRASGAMIT
jgi:hypothetical protein